MDVTPRELRDIDIRERFGGYNRDDVDDLLERAAARIEALEGQVRDLSTRAEAGDVESGKTRETEEMLHRTLLLAQRVADEAVAEAQAKARQILDDAESKSRTMVSEAETTARRQAETERRRLESEVLELGAKRDALVADVDALERFEQDYRIRLRRAVEADLEQLSSKGSVAPSPRPTTHDVEMPAAPGGASERDRLDAVTRRRARGTGGASGAGGRRCTLGRGAYESGPAARLRGRGIRAGAGRRRTFTDGTSDGASDDAARGAGGSGCTRVLTVRRRRVAARRERATATPDAGSSAAAETPAELPWEEAPTPAAARPPLFDAEPEPEHLDDDAFFASLREAVTDETPLGPRDPSPGTGPYDQDDRGGLFRRRGR